MDPALRNVMSSDLLFNIFSKFSFEQKTKTAQVCQLWKDVVYHKSMWRNIKIKIEEDMKECDVDTILPNLIKRDITGVRCSISSQQTCEAHRFTRNKLMKEMTSLKSVDFHLNFTTDEEQTELFLSNMPHLIDVAIKGCQVWKAIDNCFSLCQNIEYLTLDNCGFKYPNADNLLQNIATHLPKLRSLRLMPSFYNLTDTGIGYLTGCIDAQSKAVVHPQLETLTLGWCNITDQSLQHISSGFHSLKQLDLYSKHITNRGVGYLAKMKCLKELGLYANINEDCLKLLSDEGSKLTCLKVQNSQGAFTDQALEYIGQSHLLLEELAMSRWDVTDDGFCRYHGQNIKRLTLSQCHFITYKSLEIIAEKFTSLEYLKVCWCGNITAQGMKKIRKFRKNVKVQIW